MSLDRYLDDFGRDLTRATARRRRRKRVLLLPGAAALGLAAAALLPGLGGDSDTLAKARAALAPQGEMVHMVMHIQTPGDNGPRIEQWYVGEPVAWRSITEFRRSAKRRVLGKAEVAVSGDRLRIRSPDRDVVTIYRGFRKPLSTPGFGGGDPVASVREMLAKGDVHDDGVVTVDGRRVRRLVGEYKNSLRTVYVMDAQTFAPISISYERAGKVMVGATIERYERLPVNAETAKLLRIQNTTPETKYVWRDVKHP
jgi:hypothetical protein